MTGIAAFVVSRRGIGVLSNQLTTTQSNHLENASVQMTKSQNRQR